MGGAVPSDSVGNTPQAAGGLGFRTAGLARAATAGWLWSLLTIATTTVLSAVVFLITSRVLDPVDFGVVAFAVAVVALISAGLPTAFGEAIVQRPEIGPRHLDSVFWLVVVMAGLAYAALWMAAPWLASGHDGQHLVPILRVLGARLVLEALATVPGALLQRRMEFRAMAIRSVLANALGAVLCLTLVYLGLPLWGMVLSQVAGAVVSSVVTLWVARWRPAGGFRLAALRDLSGFGLYSLGGRILNEARIDQLLFGLMLGPVALGLYFFARRLHQMLTDFTSGAFASVSSVLFASLQSDVERRRAAFDMASFASTTIGFPVFIGLVVLAPRAVPLVFGPQWAGAVVMVQCWGVIGAMASLGVIQAAMIRNLGEPGWWFRYQALSQMLGWALVPLLAGFGADVVMIAIALRTVLLWPLSLRKAARMLDIGLGRYLSSFAAPALASAVAAGVVWLVAAGLPGRDDWLVLGAQMAAGLVAYGLALLLLARPRIAIAIGMLRCRAGGRP